jgi:hypothetical protein
MADDKAKAFFILHDDDAIDRKIAASVHKLFIGYEVQQMNNQRDLGMAMLNNFAVKNFMKDTLIPLIQAEIVQGLKHNLRIEHHVDRTREVTHYRISYGNNVIIEQSINLRGY